MKTAKEIRNHHLNEGDQSSMGPACPGCGRLENDNTVYAYRGFVSSHEESDDDFVVCPDCGEIFWGYFLIQDKDGTAALWPFQIEGKKILLKIDGTWKHDPECYSGDQLSGRKAGGGRWQIGFTVL